VPKGCAHAHDPAAAASATIASMPTSGCVAATTSGNTALQARQVLRRTIIGDSRTPFPLGVTKRTTVKECVRYSDVKCAVRRHWQAGCLSLAISARSPLAIC